MVDGEQATISPQKRWLVLGMVNTLQPITSERLQIAVGNEVSEGELRQLLRYLRSGRLVDIVGGSFVTTASGRREFGLGKLGKERDVNRMLYLVERGKGEGGGT